LPDFHEISIPTGNILLSSTNKILPAPLQAPFGYDRFGYIVRSRKGTRFTSGCGKHYSDVGFVKGEDGKEY
jgi:hypothetical protein